MPRTKKKSVTIDFEEVPNLWVYDAEEDVDFETGLVYEDQDYLFGFSLPYMRRLTSVLHVQRTLNEDQTISEKGRSKNQKVTFQLDEQVHHLMDMKRDIPYYGAFANGSVFAGEVIVLVGAGFRPKVFSLTTGEVLEYDSIAPNFPFVVAHDRRAK